jgi:hypothetical protein
MLLRVQPLKTDILSLSSLLLTEFRPFKIEMITKCVNLKNAMCNPGGRTWHETQGRN